MSITNLIKSVYKRLPEKTKKRVDKVGHGIKKYGKTYLYSYIASELIYRAAHAAAWYIATDSPASLLGFLYAPGSTIFSATVAAPAVVGIKCKGKNAPLEKIVTEKEVKKYAKSA